MKFSTFNKMVSGELIGPFELHLDVICKSENQNPQIPPPFQPYHEFECFSGDFSMRMAIRSRQQKVNKCWLKLFSSKRSHFKLQKIYLWFFHTTQTFFNIFTFVFDERTRPFRKFNVQSCCYVYLQLFTVVIKCSLATP